MGTNTHYFPATALTLTVDDPLSIATIRGAGDNANHLKLRWLNPRRCEGAFPNWNSPDNNTNEYVIMPFAPLYIPSGYTKLRVSVCHELAAVATDTTAWKLYCSSGMYIGPQSGVDLTVLPSGYTSCTWTSSVKSAKWSDTTVVVKRTAEGYTWLLLTATNGDSGTTAKISSFSLTAQII